MVLTALRRKVFLDFMSIHVTVNEVDIEIASIIEVGENVPILESTS
jgi:hypothetical protein